MKIASETRTGWIVSVVVHGVLLLLFFLVSIPEIVQNQEFIEVTWGAPAAAVSPSQPLPAQAESSPGAPETKKTPEKTVTVKKPSQPVVLPERRMADPTEDVLPMQKAEKKDLSNEGVASKRNIESEGVGERESSGRSIGDRDRSDPSALLPGGTREPVSGTSGLGGDVEQGVSFSIQWTQGGTRKKISGDLPHYPKGVNVEAQIKILTVVLPDGTVKSTQPAQKANTALEDAAMKEVRFWRFEPLRSSQPKNEQTCVVTFLFRLK